MSTVNCYSQLESVPDDSIYGLNTLYQKDPRKEKANLTIGIFLNEEGKLPLMKAVQIAQNRLMDRHEPHGYIPIPGLPRFNQSIQALVFGADSEAVRSGRILTVQALGGTGALHVGALFAARSLGAKQGVVSAPTWANHLMILRQIGYEVAQYPYFDPQSGAVDFDSMTAYLKKLAPMTVVILHACCHNPTGADLTKEQWQIVLEIVRDRGLFPLLDIAYQGFGFGIDEDAYAPRLFAEARIPFMVASSCSKNFGLYGERVGAL
ncbi:aromatic-amino-acid aminotransferase, partial [gut metagenome]